jgi:SAM-dependent methyltransferase
MPEWDAETAEWYAANYGDYPTNRLAVEHLELPVDCVIVDIGCGTGSALRHASLMIDKGTLIGVDPVPRMIEIARALTEDHPGSARVAFEVGAAEDLPIETDRADFVFAFDSIDHWQDIVSGLEEVKRILRPGGRFVIVKDLGVPGAKDALKTLRLSLESSGFTIESRTSIQADDVAFVLLIIVP